MIARTLRARLRGIGRVEKGCGVLLGGAAVHTWRPRRALGVAALDADGVVVAARRLAPSRMWRCRGAAWMLELPSGRRLPAPGTRIRLYAIRQLGSRGALGARSYNRRVAGTLILCGTPIGNLGDAPPRLEATLREADIIYAEDTRRSSQLLQALGLSRPLRSYFAGNEATRAAEVEARLRAGAVVALLTDAGMPAISDPGLTAVRAALVAGAEVTVIPGPSAVTAALAVSGLPADRFAFEGFLPRKAGGRRARLAELAAEVRTVVLFAAPSRLVRDLEDLAATLGGSRPVAITRELSKLHEEIWRGTLARAVNEFGGRATIKGEITIVIGPRPAVATDLSAAAEAARAAIATGESPSVAVREAAAAHGVSRRLLYQEVIGPAAR